MVARWLLAWPLKLCNILLLLLGVATSLYALQMLVEYERMSQDGSNKNNRLEQRATPSIMSPGAKLSVAMPPPPPPTPSNEDGSDYLHNEPWFIYALGAFGMYVALTATTGLMGASVRTKFFLVCYNFAMILLLMLQTALVVAIIASRVAGYDHLPPDVTGDEEKVWSVIKSNVQMYEYGALSLLGLEVVSLVFSFALQMRKEEPVPNEEDDIDAYFERRYGANRSLLSQRSEEGEPAPAHDDAWSRRMRDKYGLDVSHYSYRPGSFPRAPQGEVSGRRRRCRIM